MSQIALPSASTSDKPLAASNAKLEPKSTPPPSPPPQPLPPPPPPLLPHPQNVIGQSQALTGTIVSEVPAAAACHIDLTLNPETPPPPPVLTSSTAAMASAPVVSNTANMTMSKPPPPMRPAPHLQPQHQFVAVLNSQPQSLQQVRPKPIQPAYKSAQASQQPQPMQSTQPPVAMPVGSRQIAPMQQHGQLKAIAPQTASRQQQQQQQQMHSAQASQQPQLHQHPHAATMQTAGFCFPTGPMMMVYPQSIMVQSAPLAIHTSQGFVAASFAPGPPPQAAAPAASTATSNATSNSIATSSSATVGIPTMAGASMAQHGMAVAATAAASCSSVPTVSSSLHYHNRASSATASSAASSASSRQSDQDEQQKKQQQQQQQHQQRLFDLNLRPQESALILQRLGGPASIASSVLAPVPLPAPVHNPVLSPAPTHNTPAAVAQMTSTSPLKSQQVVAPAAAKQPPVPVPPPPPPPSSTPIVPSGQKLAQQEQPQTRIPTGPLVVVVESDGANSANQQQQQQQQQVIKDQEQNFRAELIVSNEASEADDDEERDFAATAQQDGPVSLTGGSDAAPAGLSSAIVEADPEASNGAASVIGNGCVIKTEAFGVNSNNTNSNNSNNNNSCGHEPKVIKHLIDGFVVLESNQPFPVKRPYPDVNGSSAAAYGPSFKVLKATGGISKSINLDGEEVEQPTYVTLNSVGALMCEFCEKFKPFQTFKASRRFCSVSCARKYNVSKKVEKQRLKREAPMCHNPDDEQHPDEQDMIPQQPKQAKFEPNEQPQHQQQQLSPQQTQITNRQLSKHKKHHQKPQQQQQNTSNTDKDIIPEPAAADDDNDGNTSCEGSALLDQFYQEDKMDTNDQQLTAVEDASDELGEVTVPQNESLGDHGRVDLDPCAASNNSSSSGRIKPEVDSVEAARPAAVSSPPLQPPQQQPQPQPQPPAVLEKSPRPEVLNWTVADVFQLVASTPGCAPFAPNFRQQEIDGEALLLLKEENLMRPPLSMKLGPALKLSARIEEARATVPPDFFA